MKKFESELDHTLNMMEKTFLASRPYLSGDDISIADVIAISDVVPPLAAGFDIRKGRPLLTAWTQRVKQRLQPHYDEVFTPLNIVIEKFGKGQAKI